jgi:hypothetical protein
MITSLQTYDSADAGGARADSCRGCRLSGRRLDRRAAAMTNFSLAARGEDASI